VTLFKLDDNGRARSCATATAAASCRPGATTAPGERDSAGAIELRQLQAMVSDSSMRLWVVDNALARAARRGVPDVDPDAKHKEAIRDGDKGVVSAP
jgi:hypothetical protein